MEYNQRWFEANTIEGEEEDGGTSFLPNGLCLTDWLFAEKVTLYFEAERVKRRYGRYVREFSIMDAGPVNLH